MSARRPHAGARVLLVRSSRGGGGLLGPPVDPVHRLVGAELDRQPGRLGGAVQALVELRLVALGEPPQHVVRRIHHRRRPAHADAHARVVGAAHVGVHALQAVVAAVPAADLELDPEGLQLEVVVDQDAEPVNWDEVLATFLLDYVRKRTAPADASTAVRFPDLEAKEYCNVYFNASV